MVSVIFVIFGIIDFIGGLVLALSTGLFLGDIAKFIGWVLILKGIWTIFTGLTG